MFIVYFRDTVLFINTQTLWDYTSQQVSKRTFPRKYVIIERGQSSEIAPVIIIMLIIIIIMLIIIIIMLIIIIINVFLSSEQELPEHLKEKLAPGARRQRRQSEEEAFQKDHCQ